MSRDQGEAFGGPVWAVIPARWASSRFPGKILAPLAGRPVVAWVVDAVRRARGIDHLVVATDDARVGEALRPLGVEVALTDPAHPSGTDRIGEVVAGRHAAVVVNVQGDEPLLEPAAIEALLGALAADRGAGASTLVCPLEADRLDDPHAVKVALGDHGRALYFSRAAVPGVHPAREPSLPRWRHIGLYAYRRAAFDAFVAAPPSSLELEEGLEQLRMLELGLPITVARVDAHAPGVDTPDDLERCERILASRRRAL